MMTDLNLASSGKPTDRTSDESTSNFTPLLAADLIELDNEYQVQIDIPGVKDDDVLISLQNKFLELTVERRLTQPVGHRVREDIRKNASRSSAP